jgi:hypothetical protein
VKRSIIIPQEIEARVHAYLFQNELEQGAFLFAEIVETSESIRMEVRDAYLVPPEGWRVQMDVYLEMTDEERARIMKMAREGNFAAIDCHSHPGTTTEVEFSRSDRSGITDFAPYVQWKLSGKPFAALVWGTESLDGVIWHGDFRDAHRIDEVVLVEGTEERRVVPRATWFERRPKAWKGRSTYAI